MATELVQEELRELALIPESVNQLKSVLRHTALGDIEIVDANGSPLGKITYSDGLYLWASS